MKVQSHLSYCKLFQILFSCYIVYIRKKSIYFSDFIYMQQTKLDIVEDVIDFICT